MILKNTLLHFMGKLFLRTRKTIKFFNVARASERDGARRSEREGTKWRYKVKILV